MEVSECDVEFEGALRIETWIVTASKVIQKNGLQWSCRIKVRYESF